MTSYQNQSHYAHQSAPSLGIHVCNLCSPDAPTPEALKRYLAQFLWDPRVIEMARPLWWLILNGFILRTRPKKSAASYEAIWTAQGSPLVAITQQQVAGLTHTLAPHINTPVHLAMAMRYGNPSIAHGLAELKQANAQRILVLPLYPQYAAATTASVFDAVVDELKTWRWIPELRFINHYHDHPAYIEALANSIRDHYAVAGQPERLLFSFHGTPKRYFDKGDPYYCECQKTARLVAERLALTDQQWLLTFQSRFGTEPWLQPYTDKTLERLAKEGVKKVAVICPGFSADCLETLEEIDVENRALFIAAGGETFSYIPALNTRADHMHALTELILTHLAGWPITTAASSESECQRHFERHHYPSP